MLYFTEASTMEYKDHDLAWTTGNDPKVIHKRMIDYGAFGDVHEVFLLDSLI